MQRDESTGQDPELFEDLAGGPGTGPVQFQEADPVRVESGPGPSVPMVQSNPISVARDVSMTSQDMIAYALTNDKLEALDKLIAMKNAEEDRANKKVFTLHFSEMQREFPPVFRDGEVRGKDGSHKYNYISLDAILKVYSPIIAKHGFGFRWTEEEIKEGKEKRIWCIVSGHGHEERTYVDIPVMNANDFTNAIQQRGSATSYGKRYSFMNLFGVIVADEDDDAATFEEGVKLSQFITLIRESKTRAECKANYMMAIKAEGLTERDKILISEESKKKNKALYVAGVTE